MSNASQVSIGLIGCGRIAQTHLDAISKVSELKLTAVYDVQKEAAEQAASRFGARVFSDIKSLINDPSVDALLICAPPSTHYSLIEAAVKAGKHVICEKPFTISLKDALKIKKLASKSDRLVMMASKFRFTPDVGQARELVQKKVIGDVVLCEVVFCSVVDMKGRWNSDPKISGGGVLIDNGSHAVDIIRYLVGPIRSVYAHEGKKAQDTQVEDTARLHFETEDHIIGMVDLSWSLFKHTKSYVNIYGTLGTIEVGWDQSVIWDATTKQSKVFGKGYNKLEAFVNQMKHFADCVLQKSKPILDVDDALESVRVIESAYVSIRDRKWLRVHDHAVSQ